MSRSRLRRPPGTSGAGSGYFTCDYRFFVTKYASRKWKAFDNLYEGTELHGTKKEEIEAKIEQIYCDGTNTPDIFLPQICGSCGKEKYLADGHDCSDCYLQENMRKRFKCPECGEMRPRSTRGLCNRCYQLELNSEAPLTASTRRRVRGKLPELLRWQNHVCTICGEPMKESQSLEVDHIVPRTPREGEDGRCAIVREHGLNHIANLGAAHASCNRRKSNRFCPPHPKSLRKNPLELDCKNLTPDQLLQACYPAAP